MTKSLRIFAALCACVAFTFGITSVIAKGRPLPPPPVLCGCLCPDGSFITTHAPSSNACASACAAACSAGSGEF